MHALRSNSSIWSRPPGVPSLHSGKVHVWRVDLEQTDDVVNRFRTTLDTDELQRASRFYFERHRRAFVVGRGFLRDVLSRYLNSQPEVLKFSYGAYGKPALNGEYKNTQLRFNMSHSHNVGLLAITEERVIGVDVEHIRADFATEEIARRFFSRCEVDVFNTLAKEEQVAAFFRCWTRKEAFIKATGRGLSQALDGFDVTLGPGVNAELLRAEDHDVSQWSLCDIDVGEDYAAALAVEGLVSNVEYFSVTQR
jgi:4'-phosphopantetheinyl transferase